MSNNELLDNEEQEEQIEYVEQEENSGPSKGSLMVDKLKSWINNQNKVVVYIVGSVLVLAIGITSYLYLYKYPKQERGNTAIYKTQKLFESDSFRLVLKDGPKLANEFSGTDAGNLAIYMTGVSYLKTGDFKNALEFLKDVKFNDILMKDASIGLLGDAYIENKDLDKGLDCYLKAYNKSKVAMNSVRFGKKAARVYEKKNEWKKALEIYEKLKSEYKDDNSVMDIDKYIARAKAKLDIY